MPTRQGMPRLFSFSCLTQEGVRVSLLRGETATVTKSVGHELVLTPPEQVTYLDTLIVVPDGEVRPRKGHIVEIAMHDTAGWRILPREAHIRLHLQFQDKSVDSVTTSPDDAVHVYDADSKSACPVPMKDVQKGFIVWHSVQQRYGRVTLIEDVEKMLASI